RSAILRCVLLLPQRTSRPPARPSAPLEHAVFSKRFGSGHATGDRSTDLVFGVDLVPRGADHFGFGGWGNNDDTVSIGDDEVAGRETDAVDLDRHIDIDHAVSIAAVVDARPAGENGKPHLCHFYNIADCPIDNRSHASAPAGGRR